MERLDRLAADMERHLQEIILPFWIGRMQDGRGGLRPYHGRGALDAEAPRGAILYSRILWTFSAAYRTLKRPEYLECATRAKTWLLSHFTTSNTAESTGKSPQTAPRSTAGNSFTPSDSPSTD